MFPGINPKQMEKVMKQLNVKQETIDASEVIIKGKKNFIIRNPEVTKVDMMGQKMLQVTGDLEDYINEDDVKLVMEQTSVSRDEAIKALEIKITAKATEGASAGDKLFGSITKMNLVGAFEKEGHTIDKKYINIIGGNIKRLGKYSAVIRLHREVTVELPFEVIAKAN